MKAKKYVSLLIIIIVSLSNLSAQKEAIVLDTVYDKYMAWNEHYLLIGNGQESMLVKEGKISPFPVQVDRFRAGVVGVPIIQVDKRCYLLDDELDFDTDKYVNLDLQRVSDLYAYGNRISYVRGDRVFVADFDTHETDLVLENAGVFKINARYIWMQRMFPEEDYIYNLKTKQLSKLPPEFKFPKTDHPYYVVNAPLDENVHVLDLDLRDVVSPGEGYREYYIRGDLLVVYGGGKAAKVFYKDEVLQLDEEYVDVVCNSYNNLCFLTNRADKIAVLGPDGLFLTGAVFDRSYDNLFRDSDIVSIKKGDVSHIYSSDFEPILEGKYDEVRYVSSDRLLVKQGRRFKIIDMSGVEIVSSMPIVPTYVNAFVEYGPELLFAYNGTSSVLYDYDGSEIVRWTNERGDQFASPGKYYRGINLRMVKSLSSEEEERINPSGLWIWREKRGGGRVEFLCDKSGERVSKYYKGVVRLDPGRFLVRTVSGKVGVVNF